MVYTTKIITKPTGVPEPLTKDEKLIKDQFEKLNVEVNENTVQESVEQIRADLKKSWPQVLEKLLDAYDFQEDAQESRLWLKNILVSNVPHGKLNRGVSAVGFYRAAKTAEKRTEQDDLDSYIMAWCLEIMQTASLLADDVMDHSVTRRGRLCWYKEPKVSKIAINDAIILEHLTYQALRKYFGNREDENAKKNKKLLVRLIQDIGFYTMIGQYLDTKLALDKNIEKFNMKTYSTIVKYKTSYFSFYAPVATGMVALGISEDRIYKEVEETMLAIGEYFQIQDDWLDCFGDPAITGKIGTDILDGKCNWLFVKAIELCTPEQKSELLKYYGVKCPLAEERVKEIYLQLQIPEAYEEYEESMYRSLMQKLNQLPTFIPKPPLRQGLSMLYHRQK